MATCKECIHEKLCVIKAFPDAFENTEWSKKPCDHFKPTADFVPKIEVARKIFEEIRREIKAALKSNYNAKQERVEKQIPDDFVSYMCEGKIAALRGIDDFIDELEMKYTEGGE